MLPLIYPGTPRHPAAQLQQKIKEREREREIERDRERKRERETEREIVRTIRTQFKKRYIYKQTGQCRLTSTEGFSENSGFLSVFSN